jgi:hypothetical protein
MSNHQEDIQSPSPSDGLHVQQERQEGTPRNSSRIQAAASGNLNNYVPSLLVPTAAMSAVSLEARQPPVTSLRIDQLSYPPNSLESLQQQPHQQQINYNVVPSSGASYIGPTKSVLAQERENFLLFVKILFKILDEAQEPHTKSKAQRIVLECRRRSQQGDPNYNPLMDALETRLRRFVGEATWRRAHLYLHHYIANKRPANTTRPVMMTGNNIAVAVGNQR